MEVVSSNAIAAQLFLLIDPMQEGIRGILPTVKSITYPRLLGQYVKGGSTFNKLCMGVWQFNYVPYVYCCKIISDVYLTM